MRGHRETHREEGHMKIEVEIGVRLPQARNLHCPQKLEETRKDFSLEPSGASSPIYTLISDF